MKVKLIAHTSLVGLDGTGWIDEDQSSVYQNSDADILGEFAGRACYGSWDRPNPATATNQTYLAHILEVDHGSVLEHASATFYVTGVSRSLTHELIRHRAGMAYSELSQRFVDLTNTNFVTPPAIVDFAEVRKHQAGYEVQAMQSHLQSVSETAQDSYTAIVERLEARGLTRKQAREAARCVMPNATETRIVVTGNMRAWRHIIKMRTSALADAEIREFATEALRQLKIVAPSTFQDM
jgi:thymidylate synthase (FAD)